MKHEEKSKEWKLTKQEKDQLGNIEDNLKNTYAEIGQIEIKQIQLASQAIALINEGQNHLSKIRYKYDIPERMKVELNIKKGILKEIR